MSSDQPPLTIDQTQPQQTIEQQLQQQELEEAANANVVDEIPLPPLSLAESESAPSAAVSASVSLDSSARPRRSSAFRPSLFALPPKPYKRRGPDLPRESDDVDESTRSRLLSNRSVLHSISAREPLMKSFILRHFDKFRPFLNNRIRSEFDDTSTEAGFDDDPTPLQQPREEKSSETKNENEIADAMEIETETNEKETENKTENETETLTEAAAAVEAEADADADVDTVTAPAAASEEAIELPVVDDLISSDVRVRLVSQPAYIENGDLKSYQLTGLNWLISRHDCGVPGILGDEMGLGKTLQTLAFLAYLKLERNFNGPHLIVLPLSVLSNWKAEIRKWVPVMRAVVYHGPAVERRRLQRTSAKFGQFDILLTTYETILNDEPFFRDRFCWKYLIVDEAHRVKNEKSLLAIALANVTRVNTILLTGTPTQNNMHELWALLYFLFPKLFVSSLPFDRCFDLEKNRHDHAQLLKAHRLLQPIMLRRTKEMTMENQLPPKVETKVFVELSPLQIKIYKKLIERDASLIVNSAERMKAKANTELGKLQEKEEDSDYRRLMSLLMQLRKLVNHPFLIEDSQPRWDAFFAAEKKSLAEQQTAKQRNSRQPANKKILSEQEIDDESRRLANIRLNDELISSCGKLSVLDKLLKKLQVEGHRVLLFSLFTKLLDLLEDYCNYRGFKFCRLDGGTNRVRRNVDIRRFNAPNSEFFIYLISTRAGGLGINLQSADTVIHYDSDFNPQMDLQAQARCHRIGQTKPVQIYRLITEGTVEERLLARAQKKLYLDIMVNRMANGKPIELDDIEEKLTKTELMKLIQFGAQRAMRIADGGNLNAENIENILSRSIKKQTLETADDKQVDEDEDDAEAAEAESSMPIDAEMAVEHKSSRLDDFIAPDSDSDAMSDSSAASSNFDELLAAQPSLRSFQGKDFETPNSKVKIGRGHRSQPEVNSELIVDGKRSRKSRLVRVEGLYGKMDSTLADNQFESADSIRKRNAAIERIKIRQAAKEFERQQAALDEQARLRELERIRLESEATKLAEKQLFEALANTVPKKQRKLLLAKFDYSLSERNFKKTKFSFKLDGSLIRQAEVAAFKLHRPDKRFYYQADGHRKWLVTEPFHERISVFIKRTQILPESDQERGSREINEKRKSTNSQEIVLAESDSPPLQSDSKKPKKEKAEKKEKEWRDLSFIHDEICHVCKVGGSLVCCQKCPRSYHIECIGYATVPKAFFCPQHACAICSRRSYDAGGLLFRCVVCPCAMCEDHLPSESDGRIDFDKSEHLQAQGYRQPESAFFISCSHECSKYWNDYKSGKFAQLDENGDPAPIKSEVAEAETEEQPPPHVCRCLEDKRQAKKLFCVCRKPFDHADFKRNPMILCNGPCSEWFHISCVGLPDDGSEFYCEKCKIQKQFIKQRLDGVGIQTKSLEASNSGLYATPSIVNTEFDPKSKEILNQIENESTSQ